MKSELSASFRSALNTFTSNHHHSSTSQTFTPTTSTAATVTPRPRPASSTGFFSNLSARKKKVKDRRANSLSSPNETIKVLLSMGRLGEILAWSHTGAVQKRTNKKKNVANVDVAEEEEELEEEDDFGAHRTICASSSSSSSSSLNKGHNSSTSSSSPSSVYFDTRQDERKAKKKKKKTIGMMYDVCCAMFVNMCKHSIAFYFKIEGPTIIHKILYYSFVYVIARRFMFFLPQF
jgi:hypothetical protein